MSCYTGLTAALYIDSHTPGDPAPTALTGTEYKDVQDVTSDSNTSLADVSTRGNKGWRSNCATLRDLTVEITAMYKGTNAQLDTLRQAHLSNGQVVASVLTSAEGDYEGFVGVFTVSRLGIEQPLEEGQSFPITLTLYEFGEWISGTHT